MIAVRRFNFFWIVLILFLGGMLSVSREANAQIREPEVIELPDPLTPVSEGKSDMLGVEVMVNNFGFGIGGRYGKVLGPFTELTLSAGITGIRDVSEQTYTDPFFGGQIVPNKYQRGISFPIMIGIKRRLFARNISDNFRFFISGSGGPVLAFTYPYFKDIDENGFRNLVLCGSGVCLEEVNDFFSGWKDGSTQWGVAGNFKVGVDIGDNFTKLTTVEIGYLFYYFDKGLQIMEPRRPVFDNTGAAVFNPDGSLVTEPFFDSQKYFGTPKISLIFGGMW